MMDPLTRAVKPLEHRRLRKPLSEEIKNAYKTLVITLTILGVGTLGSYLYMNSLKPAKGYELEKLQAEYEDLQSELRKLNQKVIEAQSFEQIDDSDLIEDMNDINAQPTTYVDESNLAQNQSDFGTGEATQ